MLYIEVGFITKIIFDKTEFMFNRKNNVIKFIINGYKGNANGI